MLKLVSLSLLSTPAKLSLLLKTIHHQIVDAVHFSLLVNDSVEGNQVIMGPISPTYKPAITGRPKLRTVSSKRTDEKESILSNMKP